MLELVLVLVLEWLLSLALDDERCEGAASGVHHHLRDLDDVSSASTGDGRWR